MQKPQDTTALPPPQGSFDLTSQPDDVTADLMVTVRELARGLKLPAASVQRVARACYERIRELELLRAAFVCACSMSGMEALAIPSSQLSESKRVPIRLRSDPANLPGVVQFSMPGEGVVTESASAYHAPPPLFDSEGQSEAGRYREMLTRVQDVLHDAHSPVAMTELRRQLDAVLRQ